MDLASLRVEIVYCNRVEIVQFQHLQQTLEESKLHTVYSGIFEQIKPLQLVGQAAEFKFESKF